MTHKRSARLERRTKETRVAGRLVIEGTGAAKIKTPIGFFTHMLETLAKHGAFDLELRADGDVHIDQHHTVEDVGLLLGALFDRALGDKRGIARAGSFAFPMDETLVEAAIDLSGRPAAVIHLPTKRRRVGELDADLVPEFFHAFAEKARAAVHVQLRYGGNDHHRVEAAFKAFARALRAACALDAQRGRAVPSTKGAL